MYCRRSRANSERNVKANEDLLDKSRVCVNLESNMSVMLSELITGLSVPVSRAVGTGLPGRRPGSPGPQARGPRAAGPGHARKRYETAEGLN